MFYDLSILLVGFVHLHGACLLRKTFHISCEDLFSLDVHIHLLQNQEITRDNVHPLESLI
jgi:hypothetical protein